MKKTLYFLIVSVFCLLATTVTVNAISPQWFVGYQFNENGKTVTKEYTRVGSFTNGLELLEKYTEGTTTVQLEGQKKGLLFWSRVGNLMDINAIGKGPMNHVIKENSYTASGENKIRVIWRQTTGGHLAAFLLYNSTQMSS